MTDGYFMRRGFLSEPETRELRAQVLAREDLFHDVASKLRMNSPYSVVDGHRVEAELADVYALVQGRLREALEEVFGLPLQLMRDRRRAIRIQRYRRKCEGLLWHLDGGMYSILLCLENTNGGATEILPRGLSRVLKPVPYVLFPFQGLLERAPTTRIVSSPGDLLTIQGGALIHRGTNPSDEGERLVLVASYDSPDRRPTPVWDWLARKLNY